MTGSKKRTAWNKGMVKELSHSFGRIVSDETRKKISLANKGHKHTEEAKKKMGRKGRIMSIESKLKMSEAKKKIGVPWLKGKCLSRTRKEQLSIAQTKRVLEGRHNNYKGGISKNKKYVSWTKNKRNRVIKRLKIESLSHTFGEWELLKKQYDYTCPSCKKSEPDIELTEDHIIPLSKEGSDLIENIQPLCSHCNFVKHNKIIKY